MGIATVPAVTEAERDLFNARELNRELHDACESKQYALDSETELLREARARIVQLKHALNFEQRKLETALADRKASDELQERDFAREELKIVLEGDDKSLREVETLAAKLADERDQAREELKRRTDVTPLRALQAQLLDAQGELSRAKECLARAEQERDELRAAILALKEIDGGCASCAIFLEDDDETLAPDALRLKRAWERIMVACKLLDGTAVKSE